MDYIKKQFIIQNDIMNKRFVFNSINNNSCSYTISYNECNSNINIASSIIHRIKIKEIRHNNINKILK